MKRLIVCVLLVLCIFICSACEEGQEKITDGDTTSAPKESITEASEVTTEETTKAASESNENAFEDTTLASAESIVDESPEKSESNVKPNNNSNLTETLSEESVSAESLSETVSIETDSFECTSDESSSETEQSFTFEELFNVSAYIDSEKLSRMNHDYYLYESEGPILHDFSSTANEEVLGSIIDYIKTVRFTISDSLTAKVGESTVTLYEGDRSFEFNFNTENEFVVDGVIYTSSINFPFRGKYDTGYYYIEAREELKLSSYGTVTDLTDFDLSEIHLLPIDIDTVGPDCTKDADLIVDGKSFQICSADIIDCGNWGYFSVVSDKDFSSLIPESETTSMIRFDYEYDNGSRYAFVSNNVIYTAEEIRALVDPKATEILNSDGSEYTDRVFTQNEVLTVNFAYNYGSTVSYAGSADIEKIYKNAFNSNKFPQTSEYEHFLPIYRFDTLEDLENFKAVFGFQINFNLGWDEVPSFNEATGEYDEGFFDEYSLVLVYVHSGSSSYRYEKKLSQVNPGGYLYVNIARANDPEELEELEASWFVTGVYPDDYFDDDTQISAELVRNN